MERYPSETGVYSTLRVSVTHVRLQSAKIKDALTGLEKFRGIFVMEISQEKAASGTALSIFPDSVELKKFLFMFHCSRLHLDASRRPPSTCGFSVQ